LRVPIEVFWVLIAIFCKCKGFSSICQREEQTRIRENCF
jgi:hypothetical protein